MISLFISLEHFFFFFIFYIEPPVITFSLDQETCVYTTVTSSKYFENWFIDSSRLNKRITDFIILVFWVLILLTATNFKDDLQTMFACV